MVRLETVEDFEVEDFEKVKKALDDPNSKPHQYCVKNFGFCTACNRLTEFAGNYSSEYCYIVCWSCNRLFEFKYDGIKHTAGECYISHDEQEYCTVLNDSHDLIKEFEQLHSREHQRKLFAKEREAYIRKLKRNIKESNKKVRRLAKLR